MAGNGINFTGNGGVELYAGTTGGVSFVDRGMHNINIATIKGDIIIEAGSGGIDLGVLQTGHPNTSDVMPGEIRLQTTNGGDIAAQSFGINGQRYGSVYVNSAGNLTINGDEVNPEYAVHVKTVTTPGDTSAKSFICLTAEKDVTIHGKVYAEAHGVPESVAGRLDWSRYKCCGSRKRLCRNCVNRRHCPGRCIGGTVNQRGCECKNIRIHY